MDSTTEDTQGNGGDSGGISKQCKTLGLVSLALGALSGPLAAWVSSAAGGAAGGILGAGIFVTIAVMQIAALFYICLQKTPVKGGGVAVAGLVATCGWFIVLLALLLRTLTNMRWQCD